MAKKTREQRLKDYIPKSKSKLIMLKSRNTRAANKIRKELDAIRADTTLDLKAKKTALNEKTNEGVKVQTSQLKVQDALNKKVKNPIGNKLNKLPDNVDELRPEAQYNVWEKADAEQAIMRDLDLTSLNGISMSKGANRISDLVNVAFTKMGSASIMVVFIDDETNSATLRVLNPDDPGYEDAAEIKGIND